jgi:hypothetical protein
VVWLADAGPDLGLHVFTNVVNPDLDTGSYRD